MRSTRRTERALLSGRSLRPDLMRLTQYGAV
jgi:hypothetical protein